MSKFEELARSLCSNRLTWTELADGTGVVLHLEGSEIYSLNETGMFLVERLCDSGEGPEQLLEGLVATFSIDRQTARRDLESFVDELHRLLCS